MSEIAALERRIHHVESALILLSIGAIGAADRLLAPEASLGFLYLIPLGYSALTHRWPWFVGLLALCVGLRQGDTPVEQQSWGRLALDWTLVALFLSVVVPLRRLGAPDRSSSAWPANSATSWCARWRWRPRSSSTCSPTTARPRARSTRGADRARASGGRRLLRLRAPFGRRFAVVVADARQGAAGGPHHARGQDRAAHPGRAAPGHRGSARGAQPNLPRQPAARLVLHPDLRGVRPRRGAARPRERGPSPGPPPARGLGRAEWLTAEGPAVGLLHENVSFETVERGYEPGDVFVFYTDGISEATSAEDQEFGGDRIAEAVRGAAGRSGRGGGRGPCTTRPTPSGAPTRAATTPR